MLNFSFQILVQKENAKLTKQDVGYWYLTRIMSSKNTVYYTVLSESKKLKIKGTVVFQPCYQQLLTKSNKETRSSYRTQANFMRKVTN